MVLGFTRMSSEGVGDGAGVSVDLSIEFFQKITNTDLKAGQFGVGNFFMPNRQEQRDKACQFRGAAGTARAGASGTTAGAGTHRGATPRAGPPEP